MNLGERIEKLAKMKHISLRQLARESSIKYTTLYSFVKRGGTKLSGESIDNIARALGILPEELTGKVAVKEFNEADAALSLTLGSILGGLEGKEREDMVRLLNNFLTANVAFIKYLYKKTR